MPEASLQSISGRSFLIEQADADIDGRYYTSRFRALRSSGMSIYRAPSAYLKAFRARRRYLKERVTPTTTSIGRHKWPSLLSRRMPGRSGAVPLYIRIRI